MPMRRIKKTFMAFLVDRSGATAIEYGLLVGILAIGTASIVGAIGNAMETGFNGVNNNIEEPLAG